MSAIKYLIMVMALLFVGSAKAGLMRHDNQDTFTSEVNSPLAFEGFNDNQLDFVSVESGYIRFRTNSSLVSEGEKALVLRERNSVTFHFDHDIFALSFYLNELNSTSLSYTDSAGHEIRDAFAITEVWNASTFFALTSDVGLRSFTLTGTSTASNANAVFGIDALQFTAPATDVPSPASWSIFALALAMLAMFKKSGPNQTRVLLLPHQR
ncbi:hypothetical protein J7384_13950 [Endozoicomonas sp. G2_1]|uniref:hypothetical protein n=1 Tax=Endozoicomonas sp. G2_1 TaxID=2821091 RepID=UPI001ADC488F|nr:hypothetical protein [Endozoicomonas sp. G2_1]MBO9491465.1 hypothetical protein [Endozoicomonas sp. G2_1]